MTNEFAGMDTKDLLQDCSNLFPQIAKDCASTMLQQQFSSTEPWHIVEQLPGNFDHNISLRIGNHDYNGLLTLGCSDSAIAQLQSGLHTDDLFDVLGEMLNVYCGLLMDQKPFTDRFGILVQGLPHYAAQQVFLPRAWASTGRIHTVANLSLTWGITIRQ